MASLCAIVVMGTLRAGVVTHVTSASIAALTERSTQITACELLAIVLLIREFGEALSGHPKLFFIDNMAVIATLCNGASRAPDLGALSHACQLQLLALNLSPWYEFVESWSNCSDGGSRVGVACLTARGLGIELSETKPIVLPTSFPRMTPTCASSLWRF